jgi:hypothetical protein
VYRRTLRVTTVTDGLRAAGLCSGQDRGQRQSRPGQTPPGVFLVSSTAGKAARIKRVRLESCGDRAGGAKPAFVDVPVAPVGAPGPWGLILSSNLYSEVPKANVDSFVQAFRAIEEQALRCVRVSVSRSRGADPPASAS